MIFEYATLKIIWWVILGVFIIAFAIVIGCDLGVAILLSFFGKNDNERSVILKASVPIWRASQLWFILIAVAVIGAWPLVYEAAFSCMPFIILMLLIAFFLRPIGFNFRDLLPHKKCRSVWDKALFITSLIPALAFGVAFGNLLKGIPFQLESELQIVYLGNFWVLLNPFAILAGLLSLSMFLMLGSVYLQFKTAGEIKVRAKKTILFFTINTLALFAIAGNWITFVQGYHITSKVFPNAPTNPLSLNVKREAGLWLDNYGHLPDLWILPASVFVCGLLTILFSRLNKPAKAFIFSSITVGAIILTAGCSMFPFLIPSSISLNSSLTVWDFSNSQDRLSLMIWEIIIFIPLLVMYSCWVFRGIRLLNEKKTKR
jgi:cytochrome d ubiquinol oxidase subunit II